MKALLLHHAGGDKYAYRKMQQHLLPEIESIAVELPGRSDRITEKLVTSIEAAVEDIYLQILPHLNESYFLIGNSMGALIAFLLAHKLKQENKPLPKHLFLASRLSPDAYKNEPSITGISSDDFWKVVQQYDGVPQALLAHKELKEFYEPILRSDFELLQQYNQQFQAIEKISIPTSILLGDKDTRNVSIEKMQGWQTFFENKIEIKAFDGGHFFLYENEEVPKYIKSKVFITQKQ
ncbi:MAG TPA: alpha/beta fold hydrolase [Chitinophagales bacterium]|jgi:surfactin synthase thioesterase subunit|nr:alpha/beta fold hydrolase [Chitinophagales bacterium]HQW80150.1 alpha/beta fold hydrolase [Chitinophagales bacterium]HRB68053.1 alpha/beta fold hydrolase [Chitinophagales bacterium]HRB92231.1 alpha/beta fold hydrolase [Chitinophagales bacterium]